MNTYQNTNLLYIKLNADWRKIPGNSSGNFSKDIFPRITWNFRTGIPVGLVRYQIEYKSEIPNIWIAAALITMAITDTRAIDNFRYSLDLFTSVMAEKMIGEIADFSPTKLGLQDSFRLTDYANLKG